MQLCRRGEEMEEEFLFLGCWRSGGEGGTVTFVIITLSFLLSPFPPVLVS